MQEILFFRNDGKPPTWTCVKKIWL